MLPGQTVPTQSPDLSQNSQVLPPPPPHGRQVALAMYGVWGGRSVRLVAGNGACGVSGMVSNGIQAVRNQA